MTMAGMGLYVGVDPSLRSPGLAILDATGAKVMAGSFSVGRATRGSERISENAAWARTQLEGRGDVLRVCIEGPSLGSVHREFDLGEGSGALRVAVYQVAPVEPLVVSPTSVKLFASGAAQASKELMLHAVKTNYGYDFGDDDDAADAFVLARIAWAVDHRPLLIRRCELEVVQSLLNPKAKKARTRQAKGDNV